MSPEMASQASPASSPPSEVETAQSAGLIYTTDNDPGFRRRKRGKGFTYMRPDGSSVRDPATLDRIRSLAIPPAWTAVWICASPRGHLQATGRDAKGRKQYYYHKAWQEARDSQKYERILEFADRLPDIRRAVREHMQRRSIDRKKVLATVVHLLERTLIRIGNPSYARDNGSYGLTTLLDHHVEVQGTDVRFRFVGKTGKAWRLRVTDRRIARIVRACQELPGQDLFQYIDSDGAVQAITSTDVNAYLRDLAGAEVTAKDFRTWAGTVLAAMALREFDESTSLTAAKKNLRAAIGRVADCLGNTPTICRKCYIHPIVLDAYLEGSFIGSIQQAFAEIDQAKTDELSPEEAATLTLLRRHVSKNLPKTSAA